MITRKSTARLRARARLKSSRSQARPHPLNAPSSHAFRNPKSPF